MEDEGVGVKNDSKMDDVICEQPLTLAKHWWNTSKTLVKHWWNTSETLETLKHQGCLNAPNLKKGLHTHTERQT